MEKKYVKNLKNYEPDANFALLPARQNCDKITLPDGQTAFIQFVGIHKDRKASNVKQSLLGTLPLLSGQEIVGAPNGVYTWVNTSIGLIASPVFSKLEFGSRHFDILRRMEIGPDVELYGAGEFRKEGNKITFNIASGSITVHLMRKIPNSRNYMNENAASIAETARSAFADLGDIEVVYTGNAQTLIDMPLTFEQVNFYESLGYKIYYHKDEAKCKDPDFLEPVRLSVQISQDERMKNTMRRLIKNPDQLKAKLKELDASIEAKKIKQREYLHRVGGTRARKQYRKRRTVRRRRL